MNKKLFVLLSILLVASQLLAGPVDETTARKAGQRFAQTALTVASRSDEMRLVTANEQYFAYNIGNSGFVIVSADDSFRPIIGYSDEGVFPTENPSPEMMYYLGDLSERRQAALRTSFVPDDMVRQEWAALLHDGQMPSRNASKGSFYLMKTKWNQGSPYNKFCPKAEGQGRAYAGCVATAMSQIMNYWRYPTHGTGQHSYTWDPYGELSANFGEATYEYDLMPNSISDMSPVENIDAIALFMYHCGIAVDMMYGPSGSGAFSWDVPSAVRKYFGYTNRCHMYNRDDYSLKEFQDMLKDQFDMGWPCYYSGYDEGDGGGHAFVCDGYDDKDMFHFNWGWSGSGDGFFVIDGLKVSSYAFNVGQAIVSNFVPTDVYLNTPKAPEQFTAVPNNDMQLSVTLSWVNPTQTLDGHPLENIEQIVVMRDNMMIGTIDNPIPGEAMSMLDPSGQPITVNYSIYAIYHGNGGRRAHADGINLGPTCPWTFNLTSQNADGWGGGAVEVVNSAGKKVAEVTAEKSTISYVVDVPQGWITFRWIAPDDTRTIGIEILDAEDRQVFAYEGLSSMMPTGIFYRMVNTCGGEGSLQHPTDLKAAVVDNDVVLTWNGIADPGYGYTIYRDGLLYAMVSDGTSYIDTEAAQDGSSYYVTAFRKEGETDPSNTVCAFVDDELAPRNLNAEMLENGKVKLTWDPPANDSSLVGYTIYRKAQGGEYTRIKMANIVSYTDSFMVPDGNHYYYMVTAMHRRAYVDSGPSHSKRQPDLLYAEINKTHLPLGLSIELQGEEVLLQWEVATLAESYNVYRNDVMIAQGLTETQFSDLVNETSGLQVYYVTGVMNGIESSPSYKVYYGDEAVGEDCPIDVKLFPNPAKGRVTVQAEGLKEITVFSVTGQRVLSRKADGQEQGMDLDSLDSGVYYFMIRTDQGNHIQKVVLL